MRPPFQILLGLVVVAVLGLALFPAPDRQTAAQAAESYGARYAPRTGEAMPEALRAATFRYDPAMAPADQQAIAAAIAGARPEAQQLIAAVDGLTTLRVGSLEGAAGVTRMRRDHYEVVLDLVPTSQALGPRGVSRLVLHELGHVIDAAIVPVDVLTTLDAGVPAGWGCDQGHSGACATRAERFAESFAKWAMNDIGVDLFIGYKVPPPAPSLDAWGEPLARVATGR